MFKRTTTIVVTATLLLLLSPTAIAQQPAPTSSPVAGRGSKTLLLVEGDATIPSSLGGELIEAADQIGQTMQLSGLLLEDLMVAVGCADRQPPCLKKIGESISATALLIVTARTVADKVEALFHLFDVAKSSTKRTVVLLPLDPVKRAPVLARSLGTLYNVRVEARRPQPAETGTLQIATSHPRAEIEINGQARGALPLNLRHMPVGTYRLRARLEGFHDWEGSVKVEANRATRVFVEMIPSLHGAPKRGLLESISLPTWIVAGVSGVTLGVGAIFGAHMAAQQHDFDASEAETQADIDHLRSLKETGERDAAVANVLFTVGAVALVTAAVMAYIDYRISGREAPSASPAAPAVSVGPGAVQIGLSF